MLPKANTCLCLTPIWIQITLIAFDKKPWSSAAFFNLGSAEPLGSAKILLGSAKYQWVSLD